MKFYTRHVDTDVSSFDHEAISKVTKSHIVLFCDYLVKNSDIGFQSCMNYLSCVRRQLETTHDVQIFKSDPAWYKDSRKRVARACFIACVKGTI